MSKEWESINDFTDRLKVYGGWIVLHYNISFSDNDNANNISESMVFIPDQNHEWKIK